jgi:hypothetical protein
MTDFKPPTINGVPVPYDTSVAELRKMVNIPGPDAWAAIRSLAEKSEPEALGILGSLTRSKDWRFRRSAVEAIGISPLGHKSQEIVCNLLSDPSSYVMRAAIEAAANQKISCAHNEILKLMKAAEENTRIVALHALMDLWQPSDFDLVFDRYSHDPSDRVKKQAAWTIHENLDSQNWRRIFLAWINDPVPRHRIWACELAEKFGIRSDLTVLQPLINDPNGHVRRAVAKVSRKFE